MAGYQRGWLRGDVIAGLSAGTVVIPQAMAYATIAGLPVEIGLYTCMAPMIVYAVLGGARALSVSTTSTIAVLVASTIAGLPDETTADPEATLGAAFTLTFLVGVCLLGMRVFRLGSLVENISPATLTGIRLGVGLTVAASQLPALLGVEADPEATGFFAKIADAAGKLVHADTTTVVVSLASLAVLLGLRRWFPAVPGPLVVVAGGILLVALTDVEQRGLELIDHVPTGLPVPQLPVAGDVLSLLPGALAIAVMSFLETVLVARTNRRREEPAVDTDQELLAVGAASLAGGLTQTLPPAGGFSQSAVNLRSGAHTQVAGLVTAVLAILVALFLAPLLDDLPRAVLAAMVMVAILGLLDPRDLRTYERIDRAELWVALIVAFLGLTGGMLLGVAVGVALTLVLVLRQVGQPRARPVYPRAGGGWTPVAPSSDETGTEESGPLPTYDGVLHLRLDGSLYTGNAQATHDAVLALAARADPPAQRVDLHAAAVTRVTVPFLDTLRSLSDQLRGDEITLGLVDVSPQVLAVLRRSEWFYDAEGSGLVVVQLDTASAAEDDLA